MSSSFGNDSLEIGKGSSNESFASFYPLRLFHLHLNCFYSQTQKLTLFATNSSQGKTDSIIHLAYLKENYTIVYQKVKRPGSVFSKKKVKKNEKSKNKTF